MKCALNEESNPAYYVHAACGSLPMTGRSYTPWFSIIVLSENMLRDVAKIFVTWYIVS